MRCDYGHVPDSAASYLAILAYPVHMAQGHMAQLQLRTEQQSSRACGCGCMGLSQCLIFSQGFLMQVRRVPVTTKQMDLSELTVKPPKTEHVHTVEASLRLDAIASAGFRISRAKASDLVKHGDVRCAPSLASL